jgi:uncharacterized membrane protein YgcG
MSFSSASVRSLCAIAVSSVLLVAPANAAEPEPLPLQRVVAFTSGIAYFDHVGHVEGDQEVSLRFNVDDINDLSKSMVARDFDGGQVAAVTYEAREPLARALQTFAIDLTADASLAGLLRQARGQEVELAAPSTTRGKVIGVDTRLVAVEGSEPIEADFVLLHTATGLRRIRVDDIEQLQLTDERLNAELQEALQLLAASQTSQQKSVSLSFRGQGKRRVAVGYVQEFPVWKTTYRLVLEDDQPALLQGWAIVENTTEHDWENVQLSLVSGRPISYRMDLYEPLYFERPLVTPQAFSLLRPRLYDQDLLVRAAEQQAQREAESLRSRRSGGMMGGGFGGGMGGFGGGGMGGSMGMESLAVAPEGGDGAFASRAEEVGELFRYAIEAPVNLKQQHSAMLPIVNHRVKAEKVSIYSAFDDSKHPLHGLRLTNETDLHLMQGPITVFDDSEYAGDAQIADIAPGAERLISYALDLDTEISRTQTTSPQQLIGLLFDKNQLHLTHRQTETATYNIKNSSGDSRRLLIEQFALADRELVSPPEPSEKTNSEWRFAVAVVAGQSTSFEVVTAHTTEQFQAVLSIEDAVLNVYLAEQAISPEVKAAISSFMQRRDELRKIVASRETLEKELAAIDQEQQRIRKNMTELDRNGELYLRYVEKLDSQETRIEQLRPRLAQLREQEELAEAALTMEKAGEDLFGDPFTE